MGALAKLRHEALQRKASEEKSRVEAELKESKQPATATKKHADKENDAQDAAKSKRAKKREKQKLRKQAEQAEVAKHKEKPEPVSLGNSKTYVVEEMDFSSGEES